MHRAGFLVLAVAAPLGCASAAGSAPIPDQDAGKGPAFIGTPAVQKPVFAPSAPRHPFMAPNERSNLHNDAYMTDTNVTPGPLGRGINVRSGSYEGVCGSITFDSKGRIVTVCVGAEGPKLVLLDPQSLGLIALMALPPRQTVGAGLFNDFAGGGYFYLDERDRAIIPTTTRHLYIVGQNGDELVREADIDLTGVVPNGDKIFSVLPDWSGRIWLVTQQGRVVTLDLKTGAQKVLATNEPIGNSFAVDEDGGVYVATDKAMYRFDADAAGAPKVTWREVYDDSGIAKPGQVGAGSGTTPTVMGEAWVAIADNADPMQVVVYKRAKAVKGSRLVCKAAVFTKGSSATDQSLIATRRSLIVENNYGYTGPLAVMEGKRTVAGLERVDVDRDGKCARCGTPTRSRPASCRSSTCRTGSSTRTRWSRAPTIRGTSRRSTSRPARRSTRRSPATALATTTTTRPSRSDRTGPPMSGSSEGSSHWPTPRSRRLRAWRLRASRWCCAGRAPAGCAPA